jgi:hypothetical protein
MIYLLHLRVWNSKTFLRRNLLMQELFNYGFLFGLGDNLYGKDKQGDQVKNRIEKGMLINNKTNVEQI